MKKRKKKKDMRSLALFLSFCLILGFFSGVGHAGAEPAEVSDVQGMAYFMGERVYPVVDKQDPVYRMNLYSDFSTNDTLFPSVIRMQTIAGDLSIPYGRPDGGEGWSPSSGNTVLQSMDFDTIIKNYGGNLTVKDELKNNCIELSVLSPEGAALSLTSLEGYYDREKNDGMLMGSVDPIPVSYTHLTLPTKRIV